MQDLNHDARTMRNGPPKLIDFRKVEGKKLYVDLIARKGLTEDELIATFAPTYTGRSALGLFLAPGLQMTQLAAQHVLWGDKR